MSPLRYPKHVLSSDVRAQRLAAYCGLFARAFLSGAEGHLSGADVFYLAIGALASLPKERGGTGGDRAAAENKLGRAAQVAHTNSAVYLSVDLSGLHLEGVNLRGAHLGAILTEVHLEGADIHVAHLEGAALEWANLDGADLGEAHLERAYLGEAHLERADLGGAYLEGADLSFACLEGANIGGVWLDSKTVLSGVVLDLKTSLGDIQWHGVGTVDLTRINWEQVRTLGDEQDVGVRAPLGRHEAVVRAYRQVATQLRVQGMNEVADRFLLRAQIRQRGVLLRQMLQALRRPWRVPGAVGRYLGSWVLAVLAGYGYRPGRTLLWYLAVIASFAFVFAQVTHGVPLFGLVTPVCIEPQTVGCIKPLEWYEALVLSLASFHSRGFFFLASPGDPVVILAAIEAVIGLFIEISFIATFTQRYFGAR